MTANTRSIVTETVPIDEIEIPKGRRRVDQETVKSIARSISTLGLLQPIGLTAVDYRLIYGEHRIEAYKLLGRKTIECRIYTGYTDAEIALAEIDENICRHAYDALDYTQALKDRKRLYEQIHPETRAGVAGGTASGLARDSQNSSQRTTANLATVQSGNGHGTPSFVADTAEKTKTSERTVRRDVAIGEAIPNDVAEALRGTPVAARKGQLQELATLPPQEQRRVAREIKAGRATSVRQARNGQAVPEKEATPADEAKVQIKIWADTLGRWLGKSPSIDELRAKFPGKAGDNVVTAATTLYEALKNWQRAIK